MPIYSIDKAYLAYAIGTDLSDFDNTAYVVLAAAELQATDLLDPKAGNIGINYSDPTSEEYHAMSASQYAGRYTTGYKIASIAIPMYLQTGVFLYALLGTCVSTGNGVEITTVECVAASAMTTSDYFLINCVNGAGATVANYVWFQIDAVGADPAPGGTGIEVDIVNTDTDAQVATKLKDKIDAEANYGATVGTTTVTITNANAGAVIDASDYNTDFTILTTTQGTTTHPITLNTAQTPIFLAFHWEKELTGQDLRYDFFGYMPRSWNLRCGEDKGRWIAKQIFIGDFACSDPTAADIAEPAKQTLSNYEWADLKHASGALTIKYNGTDLEFDIRGIDLTLTRLKPLWGARNAAGFPSAANISGIGIDLKLDGYVTGDNVRTLMATKPEDYVSTYLDANIVFYKSATRSFSIPLNNIYLVPDEDIMSSSEWYERKTLQFTSFSPAVASPTSVSSSVLDSLDKTYYEND